MKKLIILSLIILFLDKTQNVLAQNNLFIVDNIEVTGKTTSDNDRNRYLQVAFKNSFEKLIANIIRKENQKELISTDLKTIKSLISHYKITDEEVLGDKYSIKLTITFDRDLVGKFLQKKNISYSEIKKLEMIIYPVMIENSELEVFLKNNFFQEWNEEEHFENISFVLPVENLDDIDFIKKNLNKIFLETK